MREWKRRMVAVVVALCLFSSLIVERAIVLSPTWWFGLQACPGQKRAPALMNHAGGNKSPAELHMKGAEHFHNSNVRSTEVLWRSCRLKPSIRDHSIIITAREWRRCAGHTFNTCLFPPSLHLWLVSHSPLFPQAPASSSFLPISPFFLPPFLSAALHLPSVLISRAVFSVTGCGLHTNTHTY